MKASRGRYTLYDVVDRWLKSKELQLRRGVDTARGMFRLADTEYTRNQLKHAEKQVQCLKWLRAQIPPCWETPMTRWSVREVHIDAVKTLECYLEKQETE